MRMRSIDVAIPMELQGAPPDILEVDIPPCIPGPTGHVPTCMVPVRMRMLLASLAVGDAPVIDIM